MTAIRVALPAHLRTLARVGHEVILNVPDAPTIADVLDAIEAAFPALRGTIRDRETGARRPFIRFLACGQDLSHEAPDTLLPHAVALGADPFRVIGAIAGGAVSLR